MISKSILILAIIALGSAVRVKDRASKYETVLIDVDNSSTTPAKSIFLSTNKLYCALPTPSTQTGTHWQYFDHVHKFRLQHEKDREEGYTINFAQPFDETPKVAVALIGFDVNTNSAGISVHAESITTTGFDLVVGAPKGA